MTKSIVQDNDLKVCYLCGRSGPLEKHHCIFGTANRRLADEDGLWVWLCPDCHRNSKDSVHQNAKVARYLQHQAEVAWIYHNKSTREEFMKRYGRDYMED